MHAQISYVRDKHIYYTINQCTGQKGMQKVSIILVLCVSGNIFYSSHKKA